ncbi:MAG: glutaredoxin 3 [Candidatus Caenarcaniphilales bacterium]|nr:glutaredoxin 3 [Candidatus Caenarcaniphilales bacterium]
MTEAKKIEIYTTDYCPFCKRAKELLNTKGVVYTEINVEAESERQKMVQRTGGPRSVPQIFVDGELLAGGCDGLYERDSKGELDLILGLK